MLCFIAGSSHREADRARLVRVQGFERGLAHRHRFGVLSEHSRPRENLNDIEHRPARAKPRGEKGDDAQTSWHSPATSSDSPSRDNTFRFVMLSEGEAS